MLRGLKAMHGFTIHANDGDVGHVEDFYFDDVTWMIRYLVVDTGPWLFGRKVLISPLAIGKPDWDHELLPVDLTKEQVKQSPEVDLEQPVSREKEKELHNYYNWDYYWASLSVPGTTPIVPPVNYGGAEVGEGDIDNPNLRSANEVDGYTIAARDGNIGHVSDFLAADDRWLIRYLVVNTGNWLSGRDVLVSPRWIDEISWAEASVHVGMDRDAIEKSPEYDPTEPVKRAYEARLHAHYDRPGYWKETAK